MFKKPLINALSAAGYIVLVVGVINFLSQKLKDTPDTIGAPVAFLSLLTLSAAVMSYLFLYQPLLLFMEGKKKEAVNLFVRTIGIFAIFTAVVLVLLISKVI
ncbi:MAG: hypothetical protein K8Q97_01875 [Candidatus Andersenbacteria bacterium]|nr:hypothetical protein [Candidatus Andersenbacteria bacterium]